MSAVSGIGFAADVASWDRYANRSMGGSLNDDVLILLRSALTLTAVGKAEGAVGACRRAKATH